MLEGADEAQGLTVVIDVFRAFSLECYLMAAGTARILAVGEKEKAYALKESYPEALLVGERHEIMLPGFDYGNSPSLLKGKDMTGKMVIHTTSAGTQGLLHASRAAGVTEIITGSFTNARAIAAYIRNRQPEKVTIVAMGINGTERAEEDWLCARYLKELTEGREMEVREELLALGHTSGARFFDPALQQHGPVEDFYMCIQCSIFPFVLRAELTEEGFEMHRIAV